MTMYVRDNFCSALIWISNPITQRFNELHILRIFEHVQNKCNFQKMWSIFFAMMPNDVILGKQIKKNEKKKSQKKRPLLGDTLKH